MQWPDLDHLDLSSQLVDGIVCWLPCRYALLILFGFNSQELPRFYKFRSNLPSQIAPHQEKGTLSKHIFHQQIVILALCRVQQNWHSLLAHLSTITEPLCSHLTFIHQPSFRLGAKNTSLSSNDLPIAQSLPLCKIASSVLHSHRNHPRLHYLFHQTSYLQRQEQSRTSASSQESPPLASHA